MCQECQNAMPRTTQVPTAPASMCACMPLCQAASSNSHEPDVKHDSIMGDLLNVNMIGKHLLLIGQAAQISWMVGLLSSTVCVIIHKAHPCIYVHMHGVWDHTLVPV